MPHTSPCRRAPWLGYQVRIELTREGEKHWEDVGALVFGYVRMLQAASADELASSYHWDEMTRMADIRSRSIDIRECMHYDDPEKTPCLGGDDVANYCVGNQSGTLCQDCAGENEYFRYETGRCEDCPPQGRVLEKRDDPL